MTDLEPLPVNSGVRLMRAGLMAQHLARLGWQVEWFHSNFDWRTKTVPQFATHPNRPTEIALHANARLHLLPACGYQRILSPRRVLHQWQCAKSFSRLAETLSRPDCLLASYPYPELCRAAARYASRQGVPFVVDIRDPWPDMFLEHITGLKALPVRMLMRYYREMRQEILTSATGITAIGQHYLNWAQNICPSAKGPGSSRREDRVFYLGYEDEPGRCYQSTPERFSEAAPLRVLYVGSAGITTDISLILATAQVLAQRGEKRIEFTFVGDGEWRKAWEEQAAALTKVRFTGWLDKVALRRCLDSAHVGLLVFRGAAFRSYYLGNKFFGYLSAGLAVVSNVQGDAKALIAEHGIGATLQSESPEECAELLLRYLEQPALLDEHRHSAHALFMSKFRDVVVYTTFAEYLEALVDQQQPLATARQRVVGGL